MAVLFKSHLLLGQWRQHNWANNWVLILYDCMRVWMCEDINPNIHLSVSNERLPCSLGLMTHKTGKLDKVISLLCEYTHKTHTQQQTLNSTDNRLSDNTSRLHAVTCRDLSVILTSLINSCSKSSWSPLLWCQIQAHPFNHYDHDSVSHFISCSLFIILLLFCSESNWDLKFPMNSNSNSLHTSSILINSPLLVEVHAFYRPYNLWPCHFIVHQCPVSWYKPAC